MDVAARRRPMLLTDPPNHEAAILGRLTAPDRSALPPEAAQAILALELSQADKVRVDELAAKARAGALTPAEQAEVEAYSRVGSVIGVLKAQAHRSLKGGGRTRRAKAH